MLNDPKKDEYPLPVAVLKNARSRIRKQTKVLVNKVLRSAKGDVLQVLRSKECHCTFFAICDKCQHFLSAKRLIEMVGVPSCATQSSDMDWLLAHDWILDEVMLSVEKLRHPTFTQLLKWVYPSQMKRLCNLQYDIALMMPVSIRAFIVESPTLMFLIPELLDMLIESEPDIIREIQKYRRGLANSLVRLLHRESEKDARIQMQYAMLELPEYEQQVIVDRRLEMVDPSSREFNDYDTLLKRMRSRKHEKVRPGQEIDERRLYKRKWNREYMRKRRQDPDMRQKYANDQREIYHRRRKENPSAHRNMLLKKRNKRKEHLKDPVQAARLRDHARKGEARRQQRYETDPEYREQQRAKQRERYHKRRAQGWKRPSKKQQ